MSLPGEADSSLEVDTQQLLMLLEGRLDAAGREALERRLAAEPRLRSQWQQLQEVDGLLRRAAEADPVPTDRLERAIWLARLRLREPVGRGGRSIGRGLAMAAAIGLAVGAGYVARWLTESAVTRTTGPVAARPQVQPAGVATAGARLLEGQLVRLDESDRPVGVVAGEASLAWGQAFKAQSSARIALGPDTQLTVEQPVVLRLLRPAGRAVRLEVAGGRWHLAGAGDRASKAVIVTDGGTVWTESAEYEMVAEPADQVEGGGGATGLVLAVFAGVVSLANPGGQVTVGAGEMAAATVAAPPVKRLWEPSVQAYVDTLTRWYELSEAQQYEVGRLLSELRREQQWLYAPHEQELEELRKRMSRFWLTALRERPGGTAQYLEDYARYRQLLSDSPYRLESILARIEALLPAGQLWRARPGSAARRAVAERLGVSVSTLEYLSRRYELSDAQLVELERYVRENRQRRDAGRVGFDELLAAVNAVVPAEQIRQADRRAGLEFRRRMGRRSRLLQRVLPALEPTRPAGWQDQVLGFIRRCRLTFSQIRHAKVATEEVVSLARRYYQGHARELAELDEQIAAAGSEAERAGLQARRRELTRPLRAWADRLREKLAELPTLEQLELATQPDGLGHF